MLSLALLSSLVLSQTGCSLTNETIYLRGTYDNYVCRATLVDLASGERRIIDSSAVARTAPGAPSRPFFNFDWDRNGANNADDALLDWRRYLAAHVLTNSAFAGRSWCAIPAETSCTQRGRVSFRVAPVDNRPAALPDGAPPDCTAPTTGGRLEVSAPGLAPDNQFAFPDTPVGDMTAPVTFTVTNRSTVALRVNSVDFTGGADAPDFLKTADTCLPTSAEMTEGRGHLLGAGLACTFQLQFRPQHRDGVAECDPSAPNESCRRRATLFVTGEYDLGRSALVPVNVGVSGRATGGGIVTEPGTEICYSTLPSRGTCTETRMLRIRNSSTGTLTLTSARLTRAGNMFEAPMPFLMPFALPMGLSLDVPTRFCNVADDTTDGEFTINSSDTRNPTTVVTLVNPLRRRCP